MKLTNEFIKAQKSANFETQRFGIADMSIVMMLLTKLYTNPKLVLTQEYISNARDANREINQLRPIEITAPSRFVPTLTVRDFGPGLSPERIEKVFLFYGASTKSQDDTQTGGFGIGAKSAWAYTDTFTVASYIDGIKRVYVCHHSEGNGNLDLIFEGATDEPNGTEIQVGVTPKDVDIFKAYALRTIFYWSEKERPVLKGFDFDNAFKEFPEWNIGRYLRILPNKIPGFVFGNYSDYSSQGNNFAVIDGIPYPITGKLAGAITSLTNKCRQNFYLKFNTGELRIAPTRENLIDNDFNYKALREASEDGSALIEEYIQNELKKHNDISSKLKKFIELFQQFNMDSSCEGYKINGHAIWLEALAGTNFCWGLDYRDKRREHSNLPLDYSNNVFYEDIKESASKRKFRLAKAPTARILNKPLTDAQIEEIKAELEAGNLVAKNANQTWLIKKIGPFWNQYYHDKMVKDLDIKPLSSIDISDYVPPTRAKEIEKKDFCFHIFTDRLMPTQLTIADIDKVHYFDYIDSPRYVARDKDGFPELCLYLEKEGIKFGFIAKSNQDKIDNCALLEPVETLLNNHVPSQDYIRMSLLQTCIDYYRQFKYLTDIPERDQIEDEDLKLIVKCFEGQEVSFIRNFPLNMFKAVESTEVFKTVKPLIDDPKEKSRLMNLKYPLLNYCQTYNLARDKRARISLIEYMNHIHRSGKNGDKD